jgi:hypothetical protein
MIRKLIKRIVSINLCILLFFVILASCSNQQNSPTSSSDEQGCIDFNMNLNSLVAKGYDVNSISITLTHQTTGKIVKADITVDPADNTASKKISGLRTGMWTIYIELSDEYGVIGTGSGNADIMAMQTVNAIVKLTLNTGGVTIIIDWGEEALPRNGLIGEWLFDGNANDTSGNGNNGTVHGATLITDRFGKANNAYCFDGVDDYIDCGSSTVYDISETITLSGWIKTTDTRAGHDSNTGGNINYSIISKCNGCLWSDEAQAYMFGIHGGLVQTFFNATNGLDNTSYGTKTINDGKWHLITVTVDSQLSQNQIKIYTDGQFDSEYSSSGTLIKISNSNLFIGICSLIDNQGWFSGAIDDLRIYNRTLIDSEIQALFNDGGWTGN